jgi:hypothetical protein
MAAGKTQWFANGATAKLCIATVQINNAFKMTKTSERLWEERRDQRVFVH